jgi:hypothetical protein
MFSIMIKFLRLGRKVELVLQIIMMGVGCTLLFYRNITSEWMVAMVGACMMIVTSVPGYVVQVP